VVRVDPLLQPFLQAPSDEAAEIALSQLISQHAQPVVKNIVGYKFRVFFKEDNRTSNHDAEDVHSETLVNLLGRLSDLRANPELEVIRDFRSYVAVTTYRACYEHLRRKYPRRFSLKNKLRYLLRHHSELALWETAESEWLGGLSAWRDKLGPDPDRLRQLLENFGLFERELPNGAAVNASLIDLVKGVFRWTGAPVELDDLVSIVVEAWQIEDQPVHHEIDTVRALPAVVEPRVEDEVVDRSLLSNLWTEIGKMSEGHCAALLLNLRDERGGSALDLFLFTGVASFKQIAKTIGETEEWLAQVWQQLPLDDSTIAERRGLIRQQVINLRRTARLRLAKYLKGT